jgi:hypothetical protein
VTVCTEDPDRKASPADRPLEGLSQGDIHQRFASALAQADGFLGAHCVHELWMRGELALNIERALEALWSRAVRISI